jgi:hydrogenase maturation protease
MNEDAGTAPRIVIVGVGNLLMKDEGVGIHAVRRLQELDLPGDVETIDGGTSPDLIAYTRAGDKLIIVDAAKAGGEPGAVYRFLPEDLAHDAGDLASAHQLGVVPNLKLLAMAGHPPGETVIIGVEPAEVAPGLELTDTLAARLPAIVEVVLKEAGLGTAGSL